MMAILGGGASGCVTYSAVEPSVKGRAWVSTGKAYWNCDASAGEPTCYQVKTTPLAGGAK